jgi:tetratricopeptide (TPR) repeat protein
MMKFRFTIILLFFVSLAVAGCGGDATTPANENANVETPAAPQPGTQVSEIADANLALAEGNRLFDANMTEEAIAAYRRAVELDPTLGEPYFKMGIALSLMENEQLRSGTGDYVPGEANTAKNYKPESVKMFEKAVDAYKKYLDKNPKDATGHFTLGLAYNKLNLDKEAEEALEEAVELRPEDPEMQTELGGIRVKLAKYREAIPPLKKALELDPDSSVAANLLEEAQAGARRVEFQQPDNTNTNTAKRQAGGSNTSASNSNADANSAKRPPTNAAPSPKPAQPRPPAAPGRTPKPN